MGLLGETDVHTLPVRARLINAAAALAEEEPGSIALREVARRAGVTHNAPYRHFADRAALIAAVAESGFDAMQRYVRDAQAEFGPDPPSRWKAIGVAYLRFALDRPGLFRVMFSSEAGIDAPQVRAAEASVFAMCVDAIASGQRAGLVVDGDPQELAMVSWTTMHGLAMFILNGLADWVGLQRPSDELARTFMRHLFRGFATQKAMEESETTAAGPTSGDLEPY